MAFSIENKKQIGFDIFLLKEDNTGTVVEIIPAFGAIMHGFSIINNGKPINLIEQYKDIKDFKNTVEQEGFKSCKLSPFACRVKNATYNLGDQAYTFNKFILGKSALHGLLYDADFKVVHQAVTGAAASIVLFYQYFSTDNGYPFNYDCEITYCLSADNALDIITKITNKSENDIPYQDGWHPYFIFGKPIDTLKLQLKSLHKIELDNELIPTGAKTVYKQFEHFKEIGNTEFDDCFEVNSAHDQAVCILKDEEQKIQIEIYPDKAYPYLQLYTPSHRNSIAIENLSAIPDAYNNQIGLITLTPQETKIFSTRYKISH